MATTDVKIDLPTLHAGQVAAFNSPARFLALRCGRRWGKTKFGVALTADAALRSKRIGWFAPEHKFLVEPWAEMVDTLGNVIKASSETKGSMSLYGGGKIDAWSLDNALAGRGRQYDLVIIDEAAFAKAGMVDIWRRNIRPTLVDRRGQAIAMSNANGDDPENFFWQICNEPEHGFKQFHAPSTSNPHLPPEELVEVKAASHPLVWLQEYEAEFVDWSGVAFFSMDKLLVGGQPVEFPHICDGVFAVIDSATKTGKENDGTGVVFCAYSKGNYGVPPLVILDWGLQQIEGALLEQWLPSVFQRLEEFARTCRARHGSLGAWIEDKASGMILLQQAQNKQMPARAIDSKLTALGKSERAISVSGYIHNDKVKLARQAYDRVETYKGTTRNHLVSQVTGFRVGNKDPKAQDDLLDCFTYSTAIALGNAGGF